MSAVALAKGPALDIRDVAADAPWAWLGEAVADVQAMPAISLGYGAVLVAGGIALALLLAQAGLLSVFPIFAAAFLLTGPLLAAGLYEASRRRAAGLPVKVRDVLFVRAAAPIQLGILGILLFVAFAVWMEIAVLLYAVLGGGTYVPFTEFSAFLISTPRGLALLVLGTAAGGVIAFVIFALSALSVPILLVQRVDAISAMATSVSAVRRNPRAMLLWAWLIAVIMAAGFLAGLVGLILAFPLVAHATWHAYADFFSGKGSSSA